MSVTITAPDMSTGLARYEFDDGRVFFGRPVVSASRNLRTDETVIDFGMTETVTTFEEAIDREWLIPEDRVEFLGDGRWVLLPAATDSTTPSRTQ